MKWMIKGTASIMEWACQPIITDNVLFPARVNSPRILPFGIHCLVLRVCYARRRFDYWYPKYGGLSPFRLYGMIADWLWL